MRTVTLVLALVFLFASSASAEWGVYSCSLFARDCVLKEVDFNDTLNAGTCTGYVLAVLHYGEGRAFCSPVSGITQNEARFLSLKWIKEHPEETALEARYCIERALGEKYPCTRR